MTWLCWITGGRPTAIISLDPAAKVIVQVVGTLLQPRRFTGPSCSEPHDWPLVYKRRAGVVAAVSCALDALRVRDVEVGARQSHTQYLEI
jgi:hypothetical protein